MTFMQQIEISSVNEKLKLLVDYSTATKLMKDKDYLRQYVENLRKAGILKTNSDKENGVTKQDETTTKQKVHTSNSNFDAEDGTTKVVESDISIWRTSPTTCTMTKNEDDTQKVANQHEASGLSNVIINEKEQEDTQSSENTGLAERTPVFFAANNNQTVVTSQNAKDNGSNDKDNDSNTAEWSHSATLLLVSKRLEMESEFQKPILKNKLWAKISNIMKENGHNFSSSECHTKWRNMLCTYRKNVERSKHSGSGNIRWEYYNMIHEVYRRKPKINSPETLQISSNVNPTCSDTEEVITTTYSPTLQERSSPSEDVFAQSPCYKRKRSCEDPPEWFKEFLERREEEKRKKEELDEKRWRHLRELENKKIEVMNELTTVLQKFLEK